MEKVGSKLLITPGEHLKDILHDNNINIYDFCTKYPDVIGIVNEYMRVDDRIAHILEEALNIEASFWLNLQKIYDDRKSGKVVDVSE